MSEMDKLTYERCIEVLTLYKGWNSQQQSSRPDEQAILDARRKLLLIATEGIVKYIENGKSDE